MRTLFAKQEPQLDFFFAQGYVRRQLNMLDTEGLARADLKFAAENPPGSRCRAAESIKKAKCQFSNAQA